MKTSEQIPRTGGTRQAISALQGTTMNKLRKPAAGTLLTGLAKLVLPLPMKIIYGLRITGRENLSKVKNTGIITVSNHCQYIEPVFTGLALWYRNVWYIAEELNILRRDVGWLNRLLGAVGIPKKSPHAIALPVRHILEQGDAVHFYPEGKLFYRNQHIKPFHTGAFLFALRCNAPVLPLTEVLHGRKVGKLFSFLPPKVTFVIGRPIFPEQIKKLNKRNAKHSVFFAEYVRKVMQRTIEEAES